MTNEQIRASVETVYTRLTRLAAASEDIYEVDTLVESTLALADWLTTQNDIDAWAEAQAAIEAEATSSDDFALSFTNDYGEPIATELVDLDDDECTEFYRLTTRGCDAGGYPTEDGGFVVLAGSIANPDTTRRFATRHPGSFELRQDLIQSGILTEQLTTGDLMLTSDMWFETPARAASVLSGQTSNSDAWWLSNGDEEINRNE